jgi:2-polyprenyl-3-methyl-5-hydroxy-6-metoxy-1,4-benzoquinol methylase
MIDNFATKAASWDESAPRKEMSLKFIAEIDSLEILNSKSRILDFGCGTGLIGLALANKVAVVTLVDSSPAMLKILREKIEYLNIQNTNIVDGSIEDVDSTESENLIVSLMAGHHVEDLASLFSHFHQRLKPNGVFVMGDLMSEDGSFHFPEVVPHNGFEAEALKTLLTAAGFVVEKFHVFNNMHRILSNGEAKSFEQFVLVARKC